MLTTSLDRFTPYDAPTQLNIRGKIYLAIAYRYDLYGVYSYVYIEQPSGALKIVVWQDNHDDAQPIHFDLEARQRI